MNHNPAQEINPHIPAAARWIGATPLVVFLAVYLLTSLILRDFYAMPITVAFLVSSVYAVAITRGLSTEKRVLRFSRGVADYNLLMMIWIFVLAGAFSEAAKSIGAIDATVHLILRLLPAGLLLPGLFLASCVISLSIGTSVGTVVALVPIALGFVAKVVTKALKGMCLGLPNSLLGVGVSVVKYLILLSCVLNVMGGLRILDESKTSTSYLYAPCKDFLGWAFDHASTEASSSTVDSDSLRAQQTVGDTVWVDVSHKQKPTHRKKTTSDKPKKH